MKIKQYNSIIKLLREKGADFGRRYDEICEKVKKYSDAKTEDVMVKVEGVFEDENLITSSDTGSVRILTRITITEGKNKTFFILKNIRENEIRSNVEAYYTLARFKNKKKSLIFTREEIQDYSISKYYDKYLLTTTNQKNALVGSILEETRITEEEIKAIEDKSENQKVSDVNL